MVWKGPDQGDHVRRALGRPGCIQPPTDTAGASGPQTALQLPAAPGNTQGSLQTNLAHFLFPFSAPPKAYGLDNKPKCLTINTSTQEFQARRLVLSSPFRIQAQHGGLRVAVPDNAVWRKEADPYL